MKSVLLDSKSTSKSTKFSWSHFMAAMYATSFTIEVKKRPEDQRYRGLIIAVPGDTLKTAESVRDALTNKIDKKQGCYFKAVQLPDLSTLLDELLDPWDMIQTRWNTSARWTAAPSCRH